MTPGQELEEIACSFCVPHQGSGFHPGCIYCMRSYAAVKAGYERAVRNYDWVVIKSIAAERVGESPAPVVSVGPGDLEYFSRRHLQELIEKWKRRAAPGGDIIRADATKVCANELAEFLESGEIVTSYNLPSVGKSPEGKP